MNNIFWARFDSNSANNPALNLTGDAAIEITFVNETPNGDPGDLFLDQPAGGGIDPDTVVSIGGTTYSFTFELAGTLPTTNNNGAQQVPDQLEGGAVYIITVQDYPSAGDTTRLAFLPDGTVTQTEMDAFGNGAIDVQNLDTTPPAAPVCLLKGTLIRTPAGDRPVEALRQGNLVVTASGKLMPIRFITYQRFKDPGRVDPAGIRPVVIPENFFGPHRPCRDLFVSPNHRISLCGGPVEMIFGEERVFAEAKFLFSEASRDCTADGYIDYYNILLEDHDEVIANGQPVESLFLGEVSLTRLSEQLPDAEAMRISHRQTRLATLKRHECAVYLDSIRRPPSEEIAYKAPDLAA